VQPNRKAALDARLGNQKVGLSNLEDETEIKEEGEVGVKSISPIR
jgi:hypothetical protein